jgi:hypothetical protein
MFRHIAMFRWTPEATLEQKETAAAQVALLPTFIDSLRVFASGPDAGVNAGNFEFAVTADFDNLEGYLAYRDDPRHREIIAKYITPILADRAAIQYEF